MAQTTKQRMPPGPKGHPILGALPDFRRDAVQAVMDGWRQFGDIVRFGGPVSFYLLAHPDHIKLVLQDRHRNYGHHPMFNAKFTSVFGEGLVTTDGEYWLRQRRLVQPALHRQRIAAFGTLMTEATAAMLDRWQVHAGRGEALDIWSEMTHLSLVNLVKSLFSADWSRDAEAIEASMDLQSRHLNRRLLAVIDLPERVPVPANRRFLEARNALDQIIDRLIAERRRSEVDAGDLLTMLLQARDEETGEGMSDRQVRDEVKTIFIAGHDTVANGLTWTWYLLSTHPDVGSRLRAELAEVLGGRTPTLDDLPRLRYTAMVIDEALRLYPPLWLVSRAPREDDEIGGYHIPAGVFILLCPYVTHRHPDFWENPEGFDPERFAPERTAGRPTFAYFPFAGGPRKCVGENFALMEMQLIVATVAQRYRLDLVPGHPIALRGEVSLSPRHGMLMTLKSLVDG
jgi:cytochrome P450